MGFFMERRRISYILRWLRPSQHREEVRTAERREELLRSMHIDTSQLQLSLHLRNDALLEVTAGSGICPSKVRPKPTATNPSRRTALNQQAKHYMVRKSSWIYEQAQHCCC